MKLIICEEAHDTLYYAYANEEQLYDIALSVALSVFNRRDGDGCYDYEDSPPSASKGWWEKAQKGDRGMAYQLMIMNSDHEYEGFKFAELENELETI